MTLAQHDINYYLDTAHKLAKKVAAVTEQIDSERRIPEEVTNEIKDKGLFRLLMPKSLGGAELAHPDFLKIVDIFARVDGSTAWCVNQNNVFASYSSTRVTDETAREIWSDWRNVVTNGPPTSASVAIPVDGGYRLTGRWNFSSGSPHATWIAALTPVGEPVTDQDPSRDRTKLRTLLVPKSEVKMVDIWDVSGLRGTGSLGFEINDLFVPEAHTFDPNTDSHENGPLYMIPTTLLFAAGFSTVALGVARAGLDAALDLAGRKVQGQDNQLLRNRLTTQREVGEAEAIWNSAKAFLWDSATAVWDSAEATRSLTLEERVRLRLAATFGIRQAAKVVDVAYNLSGSSAIFASNPVQRRYQDVHVITQQIQGRQTHYDDAGKFYLGLEPEGNF